MNKRFYECYNISNILSPTLTYRPRKGVVKIDTPCNLLHYVKIQTNELCLKMINISADNYFLIKEENKNEEICVAAVLDGLFNKYMYIPERHRLACRAAIQKRNKDRKESYRALENKFK